MSVIRSTSTWWVTPSIEALDAKAHRVTLLKGELAYIDERGKRHKIAECEGDLIQEYILDTDYHGEEVVYYRISPAEKRYELVFDDHTKTYHRAGSRTGYGVVVAATTAAAFLAKDAFPILAPAFTAGVIACVSGVLVNVHSTHVEEKLDKLLEEAKMDAQKEWGKSSGREQV